MIPAKAAAVIALVKVLLPVYWPGHPMPDALPAQAEQESCVSLTARLCMDPTIENHAPRNNGEIGIGVFQLTKTNSFDNFAAARKLAPELKGWTWADRHDLRKQVVAGMLMDKANYSSCSRWMTDARESYACALSAYNGGLGGVMADRRLCSNTKGCDPAKWFGGVAQVSTKGKKPLSGYAKSAYQINREYVENIINVRRPRYTPYFDKE